MACIAQIALLTHCAPMLAERIGANITAARESRMPRMSLEKLAAKINPPTSYQHLSRLEKGKAPLTIEWIEKIAKALKVDPMELIAGPLEAPSASVPRLSEQVATEAARTLAAVALKDPDPDEDTVQLVSLALQELLQTFSRRPEAASDAALARIATDVVGSRYVPAAN